VNFPLEFFLGKKFKMRNSYLPKLNSSSKSILFKNLYVKLVHKRHTPASSLLEKQTIPVSFEE
jgi:hypothetical protein